MCVWYRTVQPSPSSPPRPACYSTSGPNLRRLYLPGLEGLKQELRKLEFLLERYLPNLSAHLTVSFRRASNASLAASNRGVA